jgi:colanic acid biosynthesis glycosyl transferase WcaI
VTRVPLYPSHERSGVRRILNYMSFGLAAATLGPTLVGAPDVVYVYNLITLGFASSLFRRFGTSKVVLDVQDLWPESVAGSGMMNNRFLQSALARWCQVEYRRADRLIVLSPGFKSALVGRGIEESTIDVIYNWCDESASATSSDPTSLANELGFGGRFNVVFAGTMGVMQSLDVVIQAARRLNAVAPDVLFSLVGDGIDVDRLRAEASGLANVQFIPRRPLEDMAALFRISDALLVHLKDRPSHEITIPSKTQAYMHAARPILCGVKGDTEDLVREANAGIAIRPDDPESLADAVLNLRSMGESEREQLGRNGREYYQQRLSFEHGVRRIEKVFESVTGNESPHENGAVVCNASASE